MLYYEKQEQLFIIKYYEKQEQLFIIKYYEKQEQLFIIMYYSSFVHEQFLVKGEDALGRISGE